MYGERGQGHPLVGACKLIPKSCEVYLSHAALMYIPNVTTVQILNVH